MIHREASERLLYLANTFKIVAVLGPRQSGKTTLVKATFPGKPYISLENPDNRLFANEDPRGFLKSVEQGAILDEVQRTPQLFSYLQEVIDNTREKGKFILTGSNNFLLQENITQTLAGRLAYLNLLSFSVQELQNADLLPATDNDIIFKGFYPPIYDQEIPPSDWMPNYVKTYIEKDVRQIKNVTDLIVFERFMRILAGRTSQELNLSAIGIEVGVDVKTVQSWVGILESSFIIFLLRPHFKNFNKTVVKRPKVFFYDTALVCSLLGIKTVDQVPHHPLRGAFFETMVVSDIMKSFTNKGLQPDMYFWRDKTGHEVDIVLDQGKKLIPIEIKAGQTIQADYFKSIRYYNNLSNPDKSFILYAGDQQQDRSDNCRVMNWKEGYKIVK